jgi:hypothetical protein
MKLHAALCFSTVVAALVVATSASAQSRQECKGTLGQDRDGGLFFLSPPEGSCEINWSQRSKVLTTCTLGRFCRVEGIVDICKDSGECSEITRVLSVRRR